jgi:hypothetical protein
MSRKTTPASRAALDAARISSGKKRAARREEGLAWAKAWRIRMKPWFDALYGAEPDRCPCGRHGEAPAI